MSTVPPPIRFTCADPADRPLLEAAAAAVLARYDGSGSAWRPVADAVLTPLSLGGRAGVVGLRLAGREACVKLFYDRRRSDRLRNALGRAKGRRAYENARRLVQRGIGCPRPLGCAEVRPWGPTLLLTEWVRDAERLDHRIQRRAADQRLAVDLAHFLRTLHDRGVTHRDLSPRNLLVGRPRTPEAFLLLDYEDARFAATVSFEARLRDLHHLDERLLDSVSLRHRLLGLRHYAGADYRRYRNRLAERIVRSRSKYVRAYRSRRAAAADVPPEGNVSA